MSYYLDIFLRLISAVILGGIIGYERENTRRPAGFRTHILVCVGAALAMITSEYIFRIYSDSTNIDPARLGAQVISGIGFLGAGTIIRDGFNVRGLTTAASLWAVACVGIAAGIGFFEGAVFATALIFATLVLLKKIEIKISSKYAVINIITSDKPGVLDKITDTLNFCCAKVKSIDFEHDENQCNIIMLFTLRLNPNYNTEKIVEKLSKLEEVIKAYEEK